jgi:hypothetical protein
MTDVGNKGNLLFSHPSTISRSYGAPIAGSALCSDPDERDVRFATTGGVNGAPHRGISATKTADKFAMLQLAG